MSDHELTEATPEDVRDLKTVDQMQKAPPVVCNFEGSPVEQWRKMSIATGQSTKSMTELAGQTFGLVYWLAHQVKFRDRETQEYKSGVRTVIMDAAGNAYSSSSGVIYDDLCKLISILGPGPYDPPVPVTFRSQDRDNRRIYSLEAAPERYEAGERTPQ